MKVKRGKILSQVAEPHMMFQLAAILILCIFWIGVFYFARHEKHTAESLAVQKTQELAGIYESHMVRNLGFIDQALKVVKYAYENKKSPKLLDELYKKELLPPKLVFAVSVVNKKGQLVASNTSDMHHSVQDQDFFKLHARSEDFGPVIHLAQFATQKKQIQFSRRLIDARGKFKGAVLISVEPEFFTSDYEKNEYGLAGVMGLIGSDGTYWAKRTGEKVASGEKAFSVPIDWRKVEEGQDVLPNAYFSDSVPRFSTVRRLYGYPLAIVVALSKNEQLLASEERRNRYYFIAGLISLVFGGFAIVVSRLLVQLDAANKRSRRNQETYYAALESSNDAIFVLRAVRDAVGKVADFAIEDLNKFGGKILGVEVQGLIDQSASKHFQVEEKNRLLESIATVFESGKTHKLEFRKSIPALGIEWLSAEIVRVEEGAVLVLRDITDSKRSEAEIKHRAEHDPLTGLLNRFLLNDRLRHAIARAERDKRSVVVAFIDLDNFKPINDTLGHRVGDVLLQTIASRMMKCVRKSDSIIRLGGDEFVIILEDHVKNDSVLTATLERIRDAIAQPIYFEGNRLVVTSSVGLARYPDDGEEPGILIQKADTAMYQVKTSGRNRYLYYADGMKMPGDILDSLSDILNPGEREA